MPALEGRRHEKGTNETSAVTKTDGQFRDRDGGVNGDERQSEEGKGDEDEIDQADQRRDKRKAGKQHVR